MLRLCAYRSFFDLLPDQGDSKRTLLIEIIDLIEEMTTAIKGIEGIIDNVDKWNNSYQVNY